VKQDKGTIRISYVETV